MNTNHEHEHGAANAEFELTVAYNHVIETKLVYQGRMIPEVRPEEVERLYRRAFNDHRKDRPLTAERWARTTKHLARALWHEAKIDYLKDRIADLPYISHASREALHLHEYSDTTADLLQSVVYHLPEEGVEVPVTGEAYAARARHHLDVIESPELRHELLRAEHIKAAHEYGRVIECLELAVEAEHKPLKMTG